MKSINKLSSRIQLLQVLPITTNCLSHYYNKITQLQITSIFEENSNYKIVFNETIEVIGPFKKVQATAVSGMSMYFDIFKERYNLPFNVWLQIVDSINKLRTN